jgi:alanine-glyoxylate transaminase/serine-glyoxylate transaminase/serine-pyruvate transaminase
MVVCRNGYFGDRLAEIAQRCGAETFTVDTPWGESVKLPALADELDKHPRIKAVGLVHAETSTGVLTPLPEMIKLIHDHGAIAIVDAVTSLGGHQVLVDEWDIDICYSCTQKCLGAPPGLAPITFGPRATKIINSRATEVQSFYFNMKDLETYWSQTRAYHHTTPISMTYALREALRMVMEEGIDTRIQRHARVAASLRSGLQALGLRLMAEEGFRLNPLTTVRIPDGIDDATVRRRMIAEYNIEIGGGLGPMRGQIWRIGLMGHGARQANVFAVLSALESILASLDYEVAHGASLAAAQQALASFDAGQ